MKTRVVSLVVQKLRRQETRVYHCTEVCAATDYTGWSKTGPLHFTAAYVHKMPKSRCTSLRTLQRHFVLNSHVVRSFASSLI